MSDLFFADLVRETATGSGTGPMTLTGAPAGYRGFVSVVPEGAQFHYSIVDPAAEQWEVGIGGLDGDGRLVRAPLSSSAGGEAVDFAPGDKLASLTVASAWYAERDDKSAHDHGIGQIAGLATALGDLATQIEGRQAAGDYAAATHVHVITDIEGLASALDGKQVAGDYAPAGDYAAADHTHPYLSDAPADGAVYARQDSGWVTVPQSEAITAMASGSAAAPGWAFGSDADSGFYRISENRMGISLGGAVRTDISASAFEFVNQHCRITHSGSAQFYLQAGVGGATPRSASFQQLVDGRFIFYVPDGAGTFSVCNASSGATYFFVGASAVQPGGDNVSALGGSSRRWTTVYSATGSINTSDEREKTGWRDLSDVEVAAGMEMVGELGFFRFTDSIAQKGEDAARLHFGVRAQRVWTVMASHGLVDPIDPDGRPGDTPYAFLCYDEWPEEVDGEGAATRAAGDRYGVRPDELALFLIACLARSMAAS